MIELQNDRLMISFPEIHDEARMSIDFQRTLRIPDDGQVHYLPPGLGDFPLRHVDDFATRVPAAWKEHGETLAARQRTLVALDLDSVRFTGPGTDLTVGLPRNADWLGGGSTCPDGHWFLANLPTEEVFTTPDCRRTSGEVTLTRPALISGRTVTGACFVFEEGKVVDWKMGYWIMVVWLTGSF